MEMESRKVQKRDGVTPSRSYGTDGIKARRDPFILFNKYLFVHPFIKKGFALIYRFKTILVKIKWDFFW